IGAPHAKPEASRYEVERLDQLMVRMIAWKLSGDENQAERIIDVGGTATETSHLVPPQRPTSPGPQRPARRAPALPKPGTYGPGMEPYELSAVFSVLWRSVLAVGVVGFAFGGPLRDGWRRWQASHGDTTPIG